MCGTGGLFDPFLSSTFDNSSIAFGQDKSNGDITASDGAIRYAGLSSDVIDTLSLPLGSIGQGALAPNLSIALFSSFNMTYPDGTVYPAQLGYLSMGPQVNQSFGKINASLVPGILKEEGRIGSSSYGLHVGSTAFQLPLSLWLGGYDASRLTGSVSTQQVNAKYGLQIDLFDIGIGVESGGSPFPYPLRQGILGDGNSSITSSIPVQMNAGAPYLSLPNSTCSAIARDLPVTYQAKYGLYFWNTTDPRYAQIVTSPSFLSFTFRASGDSTGTNGNMTINVPFALLNLTLDLPLISTPTSYFPCQPPQLGGQYSLGRAFLQAAFIGVNWDLQSEGEWYLAQAPGPGAASSPSQMSFGSTVSSSPSSSWADTWKNHWTPLPNASATSFSISTNSHVPTDSPPSTPEGLSGGAKAGIGIGVAVFVLILIGAATFLRRNRRDKHPQSAEVSQQTGFVDPKKFEPSHPSSGQERSPSHGFKNEQEPRYEASQEPEIYEAPGPGAAELMDYDPMRHELSSIPSARNRSHY